jgi:hypothetical protein|tara:strand:+ start:82 stop:288 length:207 start_codon:yes stop_codon:yes gene_type:complete
MYLILNAFKEEYCLMWNKTIARLMLIDELLLGGASMYEEDLMRIESNEIKWRVKAVKKTFRSSQEVTI